MGETSDKDLNQFAVGSSHLPTKHTIPKFETGAHWIKLNQQQQTTTIVNNNNNPDRMASAAQPVDLVSTDDEEPAHPPPQPEKPLTQVTSQQLSTICIEGPPLSMLRPCHGRNNNIYNPTSPRLNIFKRKLRPLLTGVYFPADVSISVTIWFLFPPPKSDFHRRAAPPGGIENHAALLKNPFENMFPANIKSDVDNLAKFALDGMNELAYADDKQVVKLDVYKMRDHFGRGGGECQGCTIIQIEKFDQFQMLKKLPKVTRLLDTAGSAFIES